MAYQKGDLIEAIHFNNFVSDLNFIYAVGNGDSGYGQTAIVIPTVLVGDVVQSAEWTDFLNVAEVCRSHQGNVATSFPPLSEVAVGEVVEAHEANLPSGNTYDIDSSIASLSASRLTADAGSVTVFANELNSVRNTNWDTQLIHIFQVTFPTVDDARYFFNSGGQIRWRGSRSGGSGTPQDLSWTNLLSQIGTMIFDYSFTAAGSIATVQPIGYYDLTTSFQNILTAVATDAYGGGYGYYGGVNNVTIDARSVDGPSGGGTGDRGRTLEFRVTYNDGSNNPFADNVTGTITSDVDERRATSPLSIVAPVYSTITPLTAGS